MSNMARTDEIDELVSSVRDFVAHKEEQKAKAEERLILKAAQRVSGVSPETVEPWREQQPDAATAGQAAHSNVLILEPDQTQDRAGLEATIAELEAAVTAQSDDWEADGGESFAQSAWAASAFKAPAEGQAPDSDADAAEAGDDDVADETPEASIAADVAAGLDEDALRALVVAMVHEELGGELGERITRNVRKLVRREINRVLTSRELGED